MSLNNARPGLQNGIEYTVAGLPWVTSSLATTTPQRLDFFKVTRGFLVRNLGPATHLFVGFTQNGVNGNFKYVIPSGSSDHFDIRTRELWIASSTGNANFCVAAELTLIDASQMPSLTGSVAVDGNGGSGWQNVG